MKPKKSRVVAKIFLFLTVLSGILMSAAGVCFAKRNAWQLPFEVKHAHILLMLGVH